MLNFLTVTFSALALLLAIISAVWVWNDSNQLKLAGIKLTPPMWATIVFLAWLPSLPAYLLLRRFYWKHQIEAQGNRLPALQLSNDSWAPEIAPPTAAEIGSEAAIRSLERSLSHLPRNEALIEMREYYYQQADADSMDIGRFEELAIRALAEDGPPRSQS